MAALGADLNDQRFDVDLHATGVELVDDRAQIAKDRLGRGDDERVGRRVCSDHRTARSHRHHTDAGTGLSKRRGGRRAAHRIALPQTALLLQTELALHALLSGCKTRLRTGKAALTGCTRLALFRHQHRTQDLHQANRLGISQIDHPDVARLARRLIQTSDQALGQVHARAAGGPQHDRIDPGVGHDRNPLPRIDRRARRTGRTGLIVKQSG